MSVTRLTPTRPSSIQGALALDLTPRSDPPTPRPRPAGPGADVVAIHDARRNQVEAWAARIGQAAVEIVGGDRPVTQLLRWTSAQVYDDLDRRTTLIAKATATTPGTRRLQPVRPRVFSVHSCFLSASVVEASVHLRYGDRSRALALRLERQADRWLCTALEFA